MAKQCCLVLHVLMRSPIQAAFVFHEPRGKLMKLRTSLAVMQGR